MHTQTSNSAQFDSLQRFFRKSPACILRVASVRVKRALAIKTPGAAQQLSTLPGQLVSSWLALRAGVLRRAVSLSARPLVTLAAPALSAPAADSHARHRRSFPFPAHQLHLHSKGFHCGLTRRLTGPIAAGRPLGYKSLAQTPARRNRPVSLYVRRHKYQRAQFADRYTTQSYDVLSRYHD